MRKHSNIKIWFTAFLLLIFAIGCGDPDKQPVGNPNGPPTVIAVTPPNGSAPVCPAAAMITATFSKAMNPATINTSTFTVSAGGVNLPGKVTYTAATNVATFTPTNTLPASTTFTGTITTGATDTTGQTLATNFTWTFSTSAACVAPGGIALGTACTFGILAGSTVTSIGATTVSGDVGVWPGSAITGFPPATATGTLHSADAVAMTAQGDLTTAYNNAAATAAGGAIMTADIGGQTLFAGNYRTGPQNSEGITGNLTLDAQGNPNAVWVFSIGSTLVTAAGNSQIILINGANSHNVFWQVGSSATLGTNTIFQGTIMALQSITLNTGATLDGRALARNGAVTLDTNTVVVPPCP